MKKKWIVLIAVLLVAIIVFGILYKNTRNTCVNYQPFTNVWNTVNKKGVKYKTISENMLSETNNFFKTHGVEIIPVYGTLLGMIRNQNIIPWNDDIDICIEKNKFKIILENKEYFKTKGIGVGEYSNNKLPDYFLKLYDLSEPLIKGKDWSWPFIDVFSWEQVNDKIFISNNWYPFKIIYNKSDYFPLKSNKFGNIILSIPNNPDIILNKMYGKDWETTCVSTQWNHRKEKGYKKTYSINCSDIKEIQPNIFDNVWVINLEKRQDRWDTTKQRLEELDIYPKRWIATNAKDKEFIDYYKTIPENKCSISEIACYKSHVKLWEYLYKNGIEEAIIFEDDIIFPPEVTKETIINVINESKGFNIIFLGHCSFWIPNILKFETPSSKIGSALCTHAYVITRKAIEKILHTTNNYSIPIDKITQNFCNKNLCYISHHKDTTDDTFGYGIVHQDNKLVSDIRDKR